MKFGDSLVKVVWFMFIYFFFYFLEEFVGMEFVWVFVRFVGSCYVFVVMSRVIFVGGVVEF